MEITSERTVAIMRVLSFDPGGERMGWGVIDSFENIPTHVDSGVIFCARSKQQYQPYRRRLIELWTHKTVELLERFRPDTLATETVPPMGAGSGGSIRLQLAATAVTAVEVVSFVYEIPLAQISARTAQKKIGNIAKKSKPKVRDGVLRLLPDLERKRHLWIGKGAIYEEPDALAIGLTALGYKNDG